MKRFFRLVLTLTLGALLPTFVQADTLPLVGNVMARKTTSLNGEWNYIVDVQEEGYYDYRMNPTSWGFFRNAKPQRPEDLVEYDFDTSPTMPIPSDWNTRDERLFFYEGTVWFKKSFDWHPAEGRNTLLYFGAVNYDCHVYVNGQREHRHRKSGQQASCRGCSYTDFRLVELRRHHTRCAPCRCCPTLHRELLPVYSEAFLHEGGQTQCTTTVTVPDEAEQGRSRAASDTQHSRTETQQDRHHRRRRKGCMALHGKATIMVTGESQALSCQSHAQW